MSEQYTLRAGQPTGPIVIAPAQQMAIACDAGTVTVSVSGDTTSTISAGGTATFGPYTTQREAVLSLGTLAVVRVTVDDAPGYSRMTDAELAATRLSVGGDDIMDPAAGQPTVTRAGFPITYRSNGAPVVASGGFLTSGAGTGQRAWYAERFMPNGCKRIGAEFKFTAGSTGRNGTIALVLWAASVTEDSDIPPTPLHFTCNRWGWTVGNLPTQNGVITNYASGRFNRVLSADVMYTVDISVDRNRVFIRLPDGTSATGTNNSLETIPCLYPCWEFYQFDGAVDDVVQIGRVWMSDRDQTLQGSPGMSAAQMDYPRRPTGLQLTSLTSNSLGTTAAIIDSAAVCPVFSGPSGASNVICRFTGWVNLAAGRSLIVAPRFVNVDGTQIAQPFMFGYTAPAGASYSGPWSLDIVQAVTATIPVNCELWANSTGTGDTLNVAGNRPLTMQFIPLG